MEMKRFAIRIMIFGSIFAVALVFGVVLATVIMYFFFTPSVDDLLTHHTSETSALYDRSGQHVLYEIHGEENRKIVAHNEIPDTIRRATLAIEDADFYNHHGIDFRAIIRALKANIESNEKVQGGSTVTQQLARNVFLTRQKTLQRKINEAILAIKIENNFSKDEILDLYLNSVPYGSNAYGVQKAAETFFGKDAKDLTLDESALLAALPQAPTYYSPYGNHREELRMRRDSIIISMTRLGWIEKEVAQKALTTNTFAKVVVLSHSIEAPHFVFYILDELESRYGKDALETGGWKVYTTLDYEMQKAAEDIVRKGVDRNKSRDASNSALVAMDPKTGEILAMVGSKDYFDKTIDGEVNVATRLRQPGSSFKPFAYAKAFEKGFQPETVLFDVSINFGPDGSGKDYIPKNYDGKSHGTVSMRQALSNSLNIPAVQTLYLAGISETIDFAHRLGITTLNDRNRYGLSLVLGGGEVKLVDMVSAFSVFAREGVRHETSGIRKIIGQDGNVIYGEKRSSGETVLDVQIARKINSILSDNTARSMIFGSNSPLAFPGSTVAAKTGTTQGFRDAWTVGYSPSLAVGVWTGNNDNHPMRAGSDGVFVAAPIWREFMDRFLSRYPSESFVPYNTVTSEKPLLTGKMEGSSEGGEVRYFHTGTGKELSAEEAARKNPKKVRKVSSGSRHSILYYVNKNDPLGNTPPDFNDPMLSRWEAALNASSHHDETSVLEAYYSDYAYAPPENNVPKNNVSEIIIKEEDYYKHPKKMKFR